MNIGIVSRSFPALTHVETADLLARNGLTCTEFLLSNAEANRWVYNRRTDLTGLTDETIAAMVGAYRTRGVAVTALGVFTNLIEPDDAERAGNLAHFEAMMRIAAQNGIPFVSTECGFTPGKRGVNADTYEADFSRLVSSLETLAAMADRHQVAIALEPCVLDVVPSAKRAADLLAQVGSDRLKILLDPANLIANSTEEEMFHHLAPRIAYFHGKDRKVNDAYGRALGDGDIDWPRFLALYHRHTEGVPFILEYVNADNFLAIRDRVLAADQAARRLPG